MLDCVEMLRPTLEMYKTHQEATEATLELERKFKDKIGKILLEITIRYEAISDQNVCSILALIGCLIYCISIGCT